MFTTDPYQEVDTTDVSKGGSSSRKQMLASAMISVFVVVLVFCSIEAIGIFYAVDLFDVYVSEQTNFEGNVNIFDIMDHLQELEDISVQFRNSRSMDLGYNASVAYFVSQLNLFPDYYPENAIQKQVFPVTQVKELQTPQFYQTVPNAIVYKYDVDFKGISFSGSGDVTSAMVYVGSGCTDAEYASSGIQLGQIALAIYTSECRTSDRADMARSYGVGGLLIYSENDGLFSSSAKSPFPFPIFAISHEVGTELMQRQTTGNDVALRLVSDTEEVVSYTINLIVDTPSQEEGSIVVSGSHLDSVEDGPGINDNGSGSAANLEIALQYARNNVKPINKVRFAWWGAEELGLKGSSFYVENLANTQPEELAKIALNVNYDMLGSPNFSRGIYNGSQAEENIRPQSEFIMRKYQSFFDFYSIPWELTPFTGRSDYGPFLDYDIPAGGLFSGAEEEKSSEERTLFGGMANTPFDPCYHQPCDTVENINREILDEMAKAAASVVYQLSMQEDLRVALRVFLVRPVNLEEDNLVLSLLRKARSVDS